MSGASSLGGGAGRGPVSECCFCFGSGPVDGREQARERQRVIPTRAGARRPGFRAGMDMETSQADCPRTPRLNCPVVGGVLKAAVPEVREATGFTSNRPTESWTSSPTTPAGRPPRGQDAMSALWCNGLRQAGGCRPAGRGRKGGRLDRLPRGGSAPRRLDPPYQCFRSEAVGSGVARAACLPV